MRPKDWYWLLGLLGVGVALYKLGNPKCKHCDVALQAITVGQGFVCPRCGRVFANTIQALLA